MQDLCAPYEISIETVRIDKHICTRVSVKEKFPCCRGWKSNKSKPCPYFIIILEHIDIYSIAGYYVAQIKTEFIFSDPANKCGLFTQFCSTHCDIGWCSSCNPPELSYFPEPGAGLDERERDELGVLLQDVHGRGVTLMVIEHDIGFVVNLCTRVIVLNYGQIISMGTPEAVQRDEKVLEAYLGEEDSDE